jgi:hypothetical protein
MEIAPFLFVFRRRGACTLSVRRAWLGAGILAEGVFANAAPPKTKKNDLGGVGCYK